MVLTDFEPAVPQYYVVKSKLTDEEVELVRHALKFTPISTVIISDSYDAETAGRFSSEVIKTHNEADAHTLAQKISADIGCVSLIVGDAELLDAYTDGARERVQIHVERGNQVQ